MKILYVNSVVDFGSTGKIVRNLANGAKKNGHEVLICYGRKESIHKEDTFYFGGKISTFIHGMMSFFVGRHGLHSTYKTNKLIKMIENFNPDVIHLHNLHGYYLNVPLLFDFLKQSEIKVFWTLHDAWSFSGSSAYFDYHGCKVWDNGCVICNNTKDYPTTLNIRSQYKTFNWKVEAFSQINDMIIITPSDWLSDMASNTFLNKYEIITLHNGIDLSTFKPMKNSFKKDRMLNGKFIILGVASFWEERKGLKHFMELSENLEEDEVLLLVGINAKQRKKLPSHIITVERTNNIEELVEIYSASDVLVNPTLEDNYPTTNLESIACGTPVISFNTGGSPESIGEGCGVVTESKNIESIRKSIDIIKEKFNAGTSKECRNHAIEYFSNRKFISASIKMYENIKEDS